MLLSLVLLIGCSTSDLDEDGVPGRDDCNDKDPAIYPGAIEEPYDGIDNDCDPLTPDDDLDGDGQGEATDCNDEDATISPDLPEKPYDTIDNDCNEATPDDDADLDGFDVTTDCNDREPLIYPGATEVCNSTDDNCDGVVDEGVTITLWMDHDQDGYGDAAQPVQGCGPGGGRVDNADDCDDSTATTAPGAPEIPYDSIDNDCDPNTGDDDVDQDGYPRAEDCDDNNADASPMGVEVCDLVDNDCDGTVDDGVQPVWYADADGDGYGAMAGTFYACTQPSGFVSDATDCDDTDANSNPAGVEVCDRADNDCNGQTDEGVTSSFYADNDGDSYGNASQTIDACTQPAGYVLDATDCNDQSAAMFPANPESCDTLDNDCNGLVDEGLTFDYYADQDQDGYGNPARSVAACGAPLGYVSDATDCNDQAASAYPGNPEQCDSLDNDCNGSTDEGVTSSFYLDSDQDGHGDVNNSTQACSVGVGYSDLDDDCDDSDPDTYPGATEICDDLVVNDCLGDREAALALCPVWGGGDVSLAALKITGELAGDGLGSSLATVDFDNDGDDDPMFGSPNYDLGSLSSNGAAYLPRRLQNGSVSTLQVTRLIGESSGSLGGTAIAGGQDLTGDSYEDVVIGAPGYGSGRGAVYLKPGIFSTGSSGIWVSSMARDGAASGDAFGTAVIVPGDVDGDGSGDLWVSAPGAASGAGRVYLLNGPFSNGRSTISGGLVGEAAGDAAGILAAVGDVDGDGLADVLVGAPGNDAAGAEAGAAYLLLDGSVADLSMADWKLSGIAAGDAAGQSLAAAGDQDGDGYADFWVGAPEADGWGAVYLLPGGAVAGPMASSLSVASVVLSGENAGDAAGSLLVGGGDVDGDGVWDLLVGAPGYDGSGSDIGALYLWRGPVGSSDVLSAGADLLVGNSTTAIGQVAAFGDYDHDGLDDVMIGAPTETANTGAAFLFYSKGY